MRNVGLPSASFASSRTGGKVSFLNRFRPTTPIEVSNKPAFGKAPRNLAIKKPVRVGLGRKWVARKFLELRTLVLTNPNSRRTCHILRVGKYKF